MGVTDNTKALVAAALAGSAATMLIARLTARSSGASACPMTGVGAKSGATARYSMPDQVARFAHQKKTNCPQTMDIESIYEPAKLKGKRVLVTGANRGLGLALCNELIQCGAEVVAVVRKLSPELEKLGTYQVVQGVDVTSDAAVKTMAAEVKGPLDIVINNAGIFMKERESILNNTMDFADEVRTIDVCAVGPLRVVNALWHAKKINQGGKIAFITSQGGSVAWRAVQSPDGGDFGHHMSKSAANMGAVLCANELRGKVSVGVLHPGFNRTEMTSKYAHIWDIEGAVEASMGAKRVCHEIIKLGPSTSGKFINCEDGLEIHF